MRRLARRDAPARSDPRAPASARSAPHAPFGGLGNRIVGAAERARLRGPTLGPIDGPHEDEADRIAAQVEHGGPVQAPTPLPVDAVQRDAEHPAHGLDDGFNHRLLASEAGGAPLPAATRVALEARMGVDLGGVRTHSDGESAALAASIGARAFTHGRHIHYGARHSPADLRLTAHEVAHTLQQGAAAGTIQRDPEISKSSSRFDRSDYSRKYDDIDMREIGVMGPNGVPIGTYGLGPCAALIVAAKIKDGGWVVGMSHYSGTSQSGTQLSVSAAYALVLEQVQASAKTYGTIERTLHLLVPGTGSKTAHTKSIEEFEEAHGGLDNNWRKLAASYTSGRTQPKSSIAVTIERGGGIFRRDELKIKYYYN